MLKKLRIIFTFSGIVLLMGAIISNEWESAGERLSCAVISISILVICHASAVVRFLQWALKGIRSILGRANKQSPHISTDVIHFKEKQGPDRIISTQDDLTEFAQQYTVIDERRTKVVGVTYRNEDGSNRQSILAHCHAGDEILLRYFEYHGAPAYAVFTEHGQIGNLSKDLAWELGQYGDDIYVIGRILAVTGGYQGLSFGCNIALTIYGPK